MPGHILRVMNTIHLNANPSCALSRSPQNTSLWDHEGGGLVPSFLVGTCDVLSFLFYNKAMLCEVTEFVPSAGN